MSTVKNLNDAKADWEDVSARTMPELLPVAIVYAAAMLASAIEKAAGR